MAATTSSPSRSFPRLASIRAADLALITQSCLFALGLFLYLSGLWIEDFYLQFAGVFLVFASNVAYAFLRLQTRLMFLFLNLGMFLFWLTRPLFGITYLHNSAWMNNTATSVTFAFMAIALALFFTRLGNDCYEWLRVPWNNRHNANTTAGKEARQTRAKDRRLRADALLVKAIRNASLPIYAICFLASLAYGLQELAYARTVSYEALRLVSASTYSSSTLGSLSAMAPCAMCAYLATKPSKRPATIMLLLNIATTVPSLLTGSRNAFVLAAAFLVFYYMLRQFACSEKGWIGKYEIALAIICIPLGMLALGMVNYTRGGHEAAPETVVGIICDALYKQGVTFNVLQYAYNTDSLLQQLGPKLYTLGPLTHTITQGFVGQLFLGSELLPEYNSIELAVKGTLYPHSMSYVTHWNYLGGEGYGSSFVLEAYADFKYAGIVIVSMLLGFTMAFLTSRMERGGFMAIVIELVAARKVFFLPRGETLDWLSFLWSTRFWLAMGIIAMLTLFFYSRYRKAATITHKTSGGNPGPQIEVRETCYV